MKTTLLGMLLLATPLGATAQITDPVANYRTKSEFPTPGILLKWEADFNGDGKKEMMLIRKSDFLEDIKDHQLPTWETFIAQANEGEYLASVGIQEDDKAVVSARMAPQIDLATCYVGMVAELGKHGLVTQQIDNPRVGDPIARIYVYTIDGDHLVRTKLAEYSALVPNPVFDKYLAEGKRSVITPVELAN